MHINTIYAFAETFCCLLPCPLGFIICAIPFFAVLYRRKKIARDASYLYEETSTSSIVEA